MALTEDAHRLVQDHFTNKDKTLAIDATCGNGYDTEFLYALGFRKIYAFDVQKTAISAARMKLHADAMSVVEFVLAGHESMREFVREPVDCIMFNFGYLPTGDKNITTNAETSISALEGAKGLLKCGGALSLMCYPGHPAGALETQAIKDWFLSLGDDWSIETHLAKSPKPSAPILFLLKRANS